MPHWEIPKISELLKKEPVTDPNISALEIYFSMASESCSCCVWSFVWSQVLAVPLEHAMENDKASIVGTASPKR